MPVATLHQFSTAALATYAGSSATHGSPATHFQQKNFLHFLTDILPVDKFQPDTNSVEDYVERVSRQIAGNLIGKARQQLIDTVEKQGEGKKMIGLVVNLFAAGFFMDAGNMEALYKRLRGECEGWEKNYLVDVDALAFLSLSFQLGITIVKRDCAVEGHSRRAHPKRTPSRLSTYQTSEQAEQCRRPDQPL